MLCDCFLSIYSITNIALDEEILTQKISSGSTGILCLFTPTHIVSANVGDSRAVLCSNKQVIALSEDHKPFHDDEKKRIMEAGGDIVNKRVNGELAVNFIFI